MRPWSKRILKTVAALCIGYLFWQWLFGYRFTEADVKRLIDKNVAVGSTKDEVMSFLASQGWHRSGYEKTPEDVRSDPHDPLHGSHGFIGAGPGTNIGPGFIYLGHIGVMFMFDENDRLTRYTTRQYCEYL